LFSGENRHQLLGDRWRMQPGHRVGELFLLRQPLEELLQRPVLVAGVRIAVEAEQPHHPALHIMALYLVPPGAGGPRDQVGGGELLHRLGVGPHRLDRSAASGQVQPE
jgi:hypothetical protein